MEFGGSYCVSHQAASIRNRQQKRTYRRQLVLGRKLRHTRAMNKEHAPFRYKSALRSFSARSFESDRKVINSANVLNLQSQS